MTTPFNCNLPDGRKVSMTYNEPTRKQAKELRDGPLKEFEGLDQDDIKVEQADAVGEALMAALTLVAEIDGVTVPSAKIITDIFDVMLNKDFLTYQALVIEALNGEKKTTKN